VGWWYGPRRGGTHVPEDFSPQDQPNWVRRPMCLTALGLIVGARGQETKEER
jgi:hypothetical protein